MLEVDIGNKSAERKSGQCLAVVLRRGLTLALVRDHPRQELVLDGIRYKDGGYGDWTGFYDWLRDLERRVIGVRYWPDDTAFILDVVQGFSYAFVPENRFYLEIYFSDDHDFDKEESKDQDFLYDKVFLSDAGEHVLVFDTSLLTSAEVDEITHTAAAKWLS